MSPTELSSLRTELHTVQVQFTEVTFQNFLSKIAIRGPLGLLSPNQPDDYATTSEVTNVIELRAAAKITLFEDARMHYDSLPLDQRNRLDGLTARHIETAGSQVESYDREGRNRSVPGVGLMRVQDGLGTFVNQTTGLIEASKLLLPKGSEEELLALAVSGTGVLRTLMGLRLPDFENFKKLHVAKLRDETEIITCFERINPNCPNLQLKPGVLTSLLSYPPPLGKKRASPEGGTKRCPGIFIEETLFRNTVRHIVNAASIQKIFSN